MEDLGFCFQEQKPPVLFFFFFFMYEWLLQDNDPFNLEKAYLG